MERKRRVGAERKAGMGARKMQRVACLIILGGGRRVIEESRGCRSTEWSFCRVATFWVGDDSSAEYSVCSP